MSLGLLDQAGETLWHRNLPAPPEALRKAIAPYRGQSVLAAACLLTWDWLADLWAEHESPVGLAQALSMQARPGGTATNAPIDAQTIAVLRRGGMLPQASVSPAERRATRALLRRRLPLTRKRAALLAQVQNTHSPYTLPASGTKMADTANRDGGAEPCADSAGQKRSAVDLARITYYDQLWRDVARPLVNTAKPQDAQPLSLLLTGPGMGPMLRLGLRYDIHQIDRVPRGQEFASDCRLVKGATESAGTRSGTSGPKIGNAHLPWAFSEAAVLFLRDNPAGQQCLTRLEKNHGTGKALPIVAPTLAPAVYCMLKTKQAFDLAPCLRSSGRGVGELAASLDNAGRTRPRDALPGPQTCVAARPGASRALALSPGRLIRPLRLRLDIPRELSTVPRCCASPAPDPNWRPWHVYPVV